MCDIALPTCCDNRNVEHGTQPVRGTRIIHNESKRINTNAKMHAIISITSTSISRITTSITTTTNTIKIIINVYD
ncbi:hypothetical protein N9L68_08855 [bacterium]|nr:hypothetical protein [bacterium]